MVKVLEPMKKYSKRIDDERCVKFLYGLSMGIYSFEFDMTNPSEIQIEISNIYGQRIYSITCITGNTVKKIDLSDYPKGIYNINLLNDGLKITNRISIWNCS